MRAGELECIVTTSALELGIDIGALDICLLNGYPGTIAGTWQRLGRAGRRNRPALGVLIATSSPLDQYIVRHPEFFLGASPEQARSIRINCSFWSITCAAPLSSCRLWMVSGLATTTSQEILVYLEAEQVLHHEGQPVALDGG